MDKLNKHQFDFSLPMYPNQTISDKGMQCEMTMDGRKLEGVTGLIVKADARGFTNVAIEFESSCAIRFAGHLMVGITESYDEESLDLLLAELYSDAVGVIGAELERSGDTLESSITARATLVKELVKSIIERIR